jgi:hypothetical protein
MAAGAPRIMDDRDCSPCEVFQFLARQIFLPELNEVDASARSLGDLGQQELALPMFVAGEKPAVGDVVEEQLTTILLAWGKQAKARQFRLAPVIAPCARELVRFLAAFAGQRSDLVCAGARVRYLPVGTTQSHSIPVNSVVTHPASAPHLTQWELDCHAALVSLQLT